MAAPQPPFIPEAFANDANPLNRNVIPANPLTAQRASFSLGFPPQTMQPVVAGGKPMLGPDMNGTLFMLSSHIFYQQSGQPYRWNADVAVAIGGYAAGTLLGSTDTVTLWFNIVNNNSTDPDAGGAGWVPMFSYGVSVLPPTTGGIVTLTAAQASKSVIVVTGALSANLQLVLPNSLRRWLIVNSTTGAFTTTVKTAAGTGVAVSQGGFTAPVEVYGDGTNLYNVVAPLTIPTDVGPSPNTYVLRSNAGYVFATYFNQNSPQENFAIQSVYADAGDGYHRKINKTNFASQFPLTTFAGQVSGLQVPENAVYQYFFRFLQPNGWIRFPGGDANDHLLIQWGTINFTGTGADFMFGNFNFPTPFINACFVIVGNGTTRIVGPPLNVAGNIDIVAFDNYSLTGARWRVDSNVSAGIVGAHALKYIAIGF